MPRKLTCNGKQRNSNFNKQSDVNRLDMVQKIPQLPISNDDNIIKKLKDEIEELQLDKNILIENINGMMEDGLSTIGGQDIVNEAVNILEKLNIEIIDEENEVEMPKVETNKVEIPKVEIVKKKVLKKDGVPIKKIVTKKILKPSLVEVKGKPVKSVPKEGI